MKYMARLANSTPAILVGGISSFSKIAPARAEARRTPTLKIGNTTDPSHPRSRILSQKYTEKKLGIPKRMPARILRRSGNLRNTGTNTQRTIPIIPAVKKRLPMNGMSVPVIHPNFCPVRNKLSIHPEDRNVRTGNAASEFRNDTFPLARSAFRLWVTRTMLATASKIPAAFQGPRTSLK